MAFPVAEQHPHAALQQLPAVERAARIGAQAVGYTVDLRKAAQTGRLQGEGPNVHGALRRIAGLAAGQGVPLRVGPTRRERDDMVEGHPAVPGARTAMRRHADEAVGAAPVLRLEVRLAPGAPDLAGTRRRSQVRRPGLLDLLPKPGIGEGLAGQHPIVRHSRGRVCRSGNIKHHSPSICLPGGLHRAAL